MSKTDSWPAVDCDISKVNKQDWYCGRSVPCRINRTCTGAVVDCRVSVGRVLGQLWTANINKTSTGAKCTVAYK